MTLTTNAALVKVSPMTFQVEALTRPYLEGKPAELSDETLPLAHACVLAQLCHWLMDEFHQLPLNLQFSDYTTYADVEEMFADIEQGHLWVSADSYDSSISPNPIYGFIFQGMHDYDHYLTHTDFSLQGETTAYNFAAKRVSSLEIQKILYSEIVLRSAAYLYLGHAAPLKIVFP